MFAIPGGGQDVDYGGGKDLSVVAGWRGDGLITSVTPRYSNVCTLEVTVCDQFSFPIDGAAILIASEGWHTENLWRAAYSYTDRTGVAKIPLGDNQNFYIRADTPIGGSPSNPSNVRGVITNAVAGEYYTATFRVNGYMYMFGETDLEPPDSSETGYALRVNWTVPQEVAVSYNGMDSQESYYKVKGENGAVAFFICDSTNYQLFRDVEYFDGYYFSSLSDSGSVELNLPNQGPWYVVFSNQNGVSDYQKVRYSVELVRAGTHIAEGRNVPDKLEVKAYPNPFNSTCAIQARGLSEGDVTLQIYDLTGRMVEQRRKKVGWSGNVNFVWESEAPSGVYLYKVLDSKGKVAGKGRVVMCR